MSLPVDARLHEPRGRRAEESIPFTSLIDLLRHRAREQPHDSAYVFLSDRGDEEARLTFCDLHQRAHAFAASLLDRAKPGDRALLLFPAGLDFVVAFLACIVAGVIPVPVMLPRRARLRGAPAARLADCAAHVALTTP